ncbi:hypothetical protein [Halomonas koreensis]|uniref:Uncharacterized protein n=1 Tax=Halomonas koreensis TaxID=245385 RepID=A0ABU1G455_9GAMM|nr:hypothetical protein [Halomonas koreensis]MDR5867308.1 hypothetical protein [Halomonas koreensis]
MMLNGSTLNGATLNGASSLPGVDDWEAEAPLERRTVYVLDVGSLRVPISSAQSTMRLSGQSFLQAVVPSGDLYIDELETLAGATMTLRKGYRYADDSLSPLEAIAEAPFETLRSDAGATDTRLTLGGYGEVFPSTMTTRDLRAVQYRSTSDTGVRRVRCGIDLFLRPGHNARDIDGVEFPVGVIQHFINDIVEFMEVLQDG